MTFMVSNGKIRLKVPTTFKIHNHSHKNTITLSLKGKLISSPSKQGQTCFISLFQYVSAYGIGKIHLKILLRRPSLSNCPLFLEKVQCDRDRAITFCKSLSLALWRPKQCWQIWKNTDFHIPLGILVVVAHETKESREGEILSNCKWKILNLFRSQRSFLEHEWVLGGKAHVFRVNGPCI